MSLSRSEFSHALDFPSLSLALTSSPLDFPSLPRTPSPAPAPALASASLSLFTQIGPLHMLLNDDYEHEHECLPLDGFSSSYSRLLGAGEWTPMQRRCDASLCLSSDNAGPPCILRTARSTKSDSCKCAHYRHVNGGDGLQHSEIPHGAGSSVDLCSRRPFLPSSLSECYDCGQLAHDALETDYLQPQAAGDGSGFNGN